MEGNRKQYQKQIIILNRVGSNILKHVWSSNCKYIAWIYISVKKQHWSFKKVISALDR